MSAKLKNVLAFAELGIRTLPLGPDSIEPVAADGIKAATSSKTRLKKLYQKHPDYNYGLVTAGNIFAVKVDGKEARLRLRKLAEQQGSQLPKTVTLRIDQERYSLFDANGKQVHRSSAKLGKGIEVYGAGRFVAGPGSKLESGTKCRFLKGRALADVKIAPAPRWLLDMVTTAAPTEATVATKADLLSIAKAEIERGENSWRKAAEALARAEKDFGATQREMGKAVGRSASWVNRLLQWRRSGYKEEGPFGPTTKAGRVAHAQQRTRRRKGGKGKGSPPGSSSAVKAEKIGKSDHVDEDAQNAATGDDEEPVAEVKRLKTALMAMDENYKNVEADLAATKSLLAEAKKELEMARRTSGAATQLDEDIPASLDRRPLSEEKERAYEAIADGWENSPEFRKPWLKASSDVRHRFFRDVLLRAAS